MKELQYKRKKKFILFCIIFQKNYLIIVYIVKSKFIFVESLDDFDSPQHPNRIANNNQAHVFYQASTYILPGTISNFNKL